MTTYRVIGKAIPRVDGPEKVTGRAQYAADVSLPGLLWGKALRSPYPHARILSIDTSEARRLPGVHAVITAADIADVPYGRTLKDISVLARDRVRFAGERVAAVVADSRGDRTGSSRPDRGASTSSCLPSSTRSKRSSPARRSSTRTSTPIPALRHPR